MLVYEILVCEFMSLCVDEDMGLFGCLFVCPCVGMSTYSWPTAPSFHMPLRPPPVVGERGREWLSCSFCYRFVGMCSILLRNVVTIFVLRNPRRVVNKLGFPLVYPYYEVVALFKVASFKVLGEDNPLNWVVKIITYL